jgi:hypothetical protein
LKLILLSNGDREEPSSSRMPQLENEMTAKINMCLKMFFIKFLLVYDSQLTNSCRKNTA